MANLGEISKNLQTHMKYILVNKHYNIIRGNADVNFRKRDNGKNKEKRIFF